jgi:hypothetical protein
MTKTSEIVSVIVDMERRHQQEMVRVIGERFPDTKWSDRIRAFSIADRVVDGAAKIADLDDYMIGRSNDPDIVAWREWEATQQAPHRRRQSIIDDLKTGL